MNIQNQTVHSTHRKEALLSIAYLSQIYMESALGPFVDKLRECLPNYSTELKAKSTPTSDNKIDKHFLSYAAGLCILNDHLELLNQYCHFNFIRNLSERETNIVVADFCNNGDSPLTSFKELNFDKDLQKLLYFIEFEKEHSTYAHETVNESLLNSKFPSLSVSLGFLRPNNNELDYLKAIIEQDIMAPGGKLVVIVSKSAALTMAPLLSSHFKIFEVSKAMDEDYCFMICEKLPTSVVNPTSESNLSKSIKKNKEIVMKSFKRMFTFVDLESRKYEFNSISNQDRFISDENDKAWTAFKSMVALGESKKDKIVIPKAPKQGELSLFIASGAINGELSLESEEGKHIVLGGVELLRDTEEKTSYSKTGASFESTVVTKSSKPFLNLLINNKGKLMIKKLKEN